MEQDSCQWRFQRPDRIKHIYRKAVKEIVAAAGPSGTSTIDMLDSAFDALDRSDEDLNEGAVISSNIDVITVYTATNIT